MHLGKWYLCRDTGCPKDYPPQAQDELIRRRLQVDDLLRSVDRLRAELKASQHGR